MDADGIVGVRLEVTHKDWGSHIAELVAIGTAIVHRGDTMTYSKLYAYVGIDCLKHLDQSDAVRVCVTSTDDVSAWMRQLEQSQKNSSVVSTFIVDADGSLWIADRHSERVACARGGTYYLLVK